MLSLAERLAFGWLVIVCLYYAQIGFVQMIRIIRQGAAAQRSDNLIRRFALALAIVGLQLPLFKIRPIVSIFHAFIFFGFSFYILVNVNDMLEAYIHGWTTLGRDSLLLGGFNLLADLFSIFVLVGMLFFLARRFLAKPKVLEFNDNVLLHPDVRQGGIRFDSLVVGVFILLHVGSRWLGTAFALAGEGISDPSLPTASIVAGFLVGASPEALELGRHICWWLAMGLIVVFLPYFPRSKHLHIMVAPVNLALNRRTPKGAMDSVADAANPGAKDITDLPWPQVLDAYACIMCTRCHEVCPAHESGTPLSPSALEINKRYMLRSGGVAADGIIDLPSLLEGAISEDAVWACTACYACVDVCPVGNEPLMDILAIRRRLVFDAAMPDELATVLKSVDEQGNSFGESARRRPNWTKSLDFEIKDAAKEPVEYLWFVGDFASFNESCQEVSRNVARVLQAAGVDFGILGKAEKTAGNDIRRVGEEGLFEALAEDNIKTLEGCDFKKIFTTDPHTFNALKNEYPALGGEYEVVHYSTLLLELLQSGQISITKPVEAKVTYHDPCYLGRYNGIYEAPREVMRLCGVDLVEMPRNREKSFCCGAGGGRIWMPDHEDMTQRPSENRIDEAVALGGVTYFTVACPKDMTMYSDAVKTSGHEADMAVRDIVDFVVQAMELPQGEALAANV